MTEQSGGIVTKRRKAMAYAKTYGFTREDRLELAEQLLRRDVGSWKDLDEPELVRLLDCLEGYVLVGTLRLQQTEIRSPQHTDQR